MPNDNLSENDLFIDALAEILNIGMGVAAASLSEMINKEVVLCAPVVDFVSKAVAARAISADRSQLLSGVCENFDGAFKGRAILLFPEPQSLDLVRALLRQEDAFTENLSEMEQEAITEIGNVILNACLCSIADVLHRYIESNVPEFFNGSIDQILCTQETDESLVLLLKMDFSIEQLAIQGYVTFLMDSDFIGELKTSVNEFLEI